MIPNKNQPLEEDKDKKHEKEKPVSEELTVKRQAVVMEETSQQEDKVSRTNRLLTVV